MRNVCGESILTTSRLHYTWEKIVVTSLVEMVFVAIRAAERLEAVVISKSFNKGGSRCNHAHILGVA